MADLPPDENNGPILIWVTAVLDLIAVLLTALRFWIRGKHRIIGWDDWTMVLAVLCANSRMIFQILQSYHGNGRHKVYLDPEEYILSSKWGWYAQLGLFGGNAFVKISICLLILRIKNTKFLKWLLYCVIVGLALVNGTFVIILLAECSPVNAYWRPTEQGQCWTPKARIYTAYIAVGYGVVTDVLLTGLPAHIVWKIQIPLRTKILVSTLMGLGIVATGFGIMRAASLGTATDDLTWDYCVVAIWSNVELWLAIIAANLALVRSMYLYFRGDTSASVLGSSENAHGPYGYPNGGTGDHSVEGSRSRRGRKRSIFDITLDTRNGTRQSRVDQPDDNVVWSECRRASSAQSNTASEAPLDPQIRKKTELYIHEDESSESSHTGRVDLDRKEQLGAGRAM
ncbi:hypothetical protein LTR37_000028 [Vermiconidia calcicola]|uniref:Uncharacterized protein n=1 Tax=Vermiconidia calcicola TaxID=1690605 RepID=A0ACC3NZR8_9PEZI|nr:hypothetical protein LTR37_000028 [Vermiconidia calcicola]